MIFNQQAPASLPPRSGRFAHHVVFLGLSIILLSSTGAQCEEPPLITDRPDFTESGIVVPSGSVQLEFGATWVGLSGWAVDEVSGPEALIRWGIGSRLELRFELPGYLRVSEADGSSRSWTDSAVGIKWQLGPLAESWDLALIAMVQLPTGDFGETADAFDPGVILTTGTDLSQSWSFGTQVSAARETLAEPDGDREIWIYGATAVLGLGVSDTVGTFFELAADWPDDVDGILQLHHGWAWQVRPTLQLDVHAAAGLTDTAPDWLFGIGLSKRW